MLACRGSAIGEKGWGSSGSQGGENESATCAKIEGELTGEIWRGVKRGSQFKGEVSPKGRREEVRLERTENVCWELHYA